jgi:O-acetyl-ADP-ribose deacetylase
MAELIPIKQDITTLQVDAIVNAANSSLMGGGGVDGSIHRASGIELAKECSGLGGCQVGEAKITKGYNLPAKYIIHTVGPVYGRDNGNEAELLGDCYKNSLKLAVDNDIKTIAFPNISTGIFSYPIKEAAGIAIDTVNKFLKEEDHNIKKVYFVSFSGGDNDVYKRLLSNE